jgi:CubicO group peptidase (beta-lactamase class C family)
MVVETASGNNYEDQCRRTVLDPMGAGGIIDPELRHRAPNGGWRMSAVDYLKFMQVWEPDAGVLGSTSWAWLNSLRGKGSYGLGMNKYRTSRGITFSHTGGVSSTVKERGGPLLSDSKTD